MGWDYNNLSFGQVILLLVVLGFLGWLGTGASIGVLFVTIVFLAAAFLLFHSFVVKVEKWFSSLATRSEKELSSKRESGNKL